MPVTGFPIATNNSPNPSNGAGFSYGGELDVTPVSTANVAVFDALTACTIVDNVFTPTSYSTACATYIAQVTDAKAQIRFIWPATDSSSVIVFGMLTPTTTTVLDEISASLTSQFIALSYFSDMLMGTYKQDANSPSGVPISAVMVEGDTILMTLEYGTNSLTFVNETQNLSLISCDLGGYPSFAESRSLFIYGNTPVSFDIANTDDPAMQVAYEVQVPENSDGKTYLVTGVTENSVINGKRLKDGDFITIFAGGTDCVVNRLLSDDAIRAMIQAYVSESFYMELASNPSSVLATEIKNLAMSAVSEALTPPDSSPVTISESIANAVGASINEALNPQNNGAIIVAMQSYVTESCTAESNNPEVVIAINSAIDAYAESIGVGGQTAYGTVDAVIDAEVQAGGIIDNAIQAAINP